jgi:hypothetical protein
MKLRLSLVAASLLLAGCNANRVVLCPGSAILADTSAEVVFRPGAPQDPSGEMFTGYLTGAKTACVIDSQLNAAVSSLDLNFRATRPPSSEAASYSLPYYVAVNQAERLISKKIFTVQFDFAPGETVATTNESVDETVVPLERGHQGYDYQLLAGFQLTDAQRAYNQKMSRYLP